MGRVNLLVWMSTCPVIE